MTHINVNDKIIAITGYNPDILVKTATANDVDIKTTIKQYLGIDNIRILGLLSKVTEDRLQGHITLTELKNMHLGNPIIILIK